MRRRIEQTAFWICLALSLGTCLLASVPIAMGIRDHMQFGTPDNLGIGIGFALLMLGSPFILATVILGVRMRSESTETHNEPVERTK